MNDVLAIMHLYREIGNDYKARSWHGVVWRYVISDMHISLEGFWDAAQHMAVMQEI